MFGVNLKLRYPFIGAIVGSGIGSAYIAFFKVKAIALELLDCLDLSQSIQYMQDGYITLFMTISFIVAITVTLILSKRKANKSCRIKNRYDSNQSISHCKCNRMKL